MGEYIPASGAHAVEQAIVGIRLFEPSASGFESATVLARKLAAERDRLPGRVQLDAFGLAFGRQAITHGYVTQAEQGPGLLFQRVRADGSMEEELTLERTAVTYRTNAYQRWDDITRLLKEVLCPVAAALAEDDVRRTSVIEFRCIDRFSADNETETPLSKLVRLGTPHIPSGALSRTSMLHSHGGWFQDQTHAGRVLININVDITDSPDSVRTASILQVISAQAAAIGEYFSMEGDFRMTENALRVFDQLHALDKKLLSEILTDDLQDRINLMGTSGIRS